MVYFPQGASIVFPEQIVEKTSPVDVAIDRALGGEYRYGKLHVREDRADILEDWMAPKPFFDYVCPQESVGIMIPTEGKHHPASNVGVTLAHSRIDLNIRDVGKYISLHETFRQNLINYMRSDEGQALAAAMNKQGLKAEDVGYIAVGFVPKNAIYAIGRLRNGKVVIYANKDSYGMVEREAKAAGMNIKEVIEAGIGEEIAHNFRKSYDLNAGILEERATKESLLSLYKTLEAGVRDTKLKSKYNRIIRHLEEDIRTIDRYARKDGKLDASELESVLEAEAAEKGITSAREISEYKTARLEELTEAAKEVSDDGTENAECEACESAEGEGSSEGGGEGGE